MKSKALELSFKLRVIRIMALGKPFVGRECVMSWRGLTAPQHLRWAWYFEYRMALYKVQYPRVSFRLEVHEYEPKTDAERAKFIRNKIRAAKGKITEMENKKAKVQAEMDKSLFNIFPAPAGMNRFTQHFRGLWGSHGIECRNNCREFGQ